ncbi:hypothetical protein N9N20_02755 [Planktomarina temperata]|nr:hypothetical protein [Planktomarina temperata]
MTIVVWKLKSIVAATCLFVAATGMAAGQSARLDPLFERLKNVDAADAPVLIFPGRTEYIEKSGRNGRKADLQRLICCCRGRRLPLMQAIRKRPWGI